MSMLLEQDMTFRLGWPLICYMACQAMIRGMTFDQMCAHAMRTYLNQK